MSQAAIAGGGSRAKPGEISLADRGVLFMDEMPEFPRAALEALGQPLESGQTTVARAAAHITDPARFQLVAARSIRAGLAGRSRTGLIWSLKSLPSRRRSCCVRRPAR